MRCLGVGLLAVLATVLGAILGAVLGIGVAFAVLRWPISWQSLGGPARPATTILGGDEFTLYVADAAGQIYVCNQRPDGVCWEPYALALPEPDRHNDCGPGAARPAGRIDYYYSSCFGEYAVVAAYRLTDIGAVEAWRSTTGTWVFLSIFVPFTLLGFLFGAIAGLVAGLLGGVLSQRRRPQAHKPA